MIVGLRPGAATASPHAGLLATAIVPKSTLAATRLAGAALDALHEELALYPKPGLVSFVDTGSHADMKSCTFLRSIASLHAYFVQIAALGATAAPFAVLKDAAIGAEHRMVRATGGVNTHRGAIFMLGMLCAAAARCCRRASADAPTATALRESLMESWGAALASHASDGQASNGQRAAREHGLRSARHEAAAGFPVLFECAVPALRDASLAGLSRRRALLQTFFTVMAKLDDTNLVHRAGLAGLRMAQGEARTFLASGGAYRPQAFAHAEAIHRTFVARRMSPGGAADALAAACWITRICA